MVHPVPTKAFVNPSPDMAMLFAPFGHTYPPPPAPPLCSLSPKDIAESDIKTRNLRMGFPAISGQRVKKSLVVEWKCI